MKLYTYLNFGGNCREAFRFYQEHLGGKVEVMMTHGEQPGGNAPPDQRDKILYARMSIGDTLLMGSDVGDKHQPMRSAYLYLSLDSTAEAERVYALLAEGGQILMPMSEQFFAIRFGMLRDRFGTLWMVIQERPQ
jgi:PhnB protein